MRRRGRRESHSRCCPGLRPCKVVVRGLEGAVLCCPGVGPQECWGWCYPVVGSEPLPHPAPILACDQPVCWSGPLDRPGGCWLTTLQAAADRDFRQVGCDVPGG